MDAEWNASEHPRDERGRFTSKDITEEYKANATPGVGRIEFEPGYDKKNHSKEIEIAEWIHKTFGGDICLLAEDEGPKRNKRPDYEWRGVLWDLKSPTTLNAVSDRTRSGIKQIRPNPGGIILDLNNCSASLDEAEKETLHRMHTSSEFSADIILLTKGNQYKVVRYNPIHSKRANPGRP